MPLHLFGPDADPLFDQDKLYNLVALSLYEFPMPARYPRFGTTRKYRTAGNRMESAFQPIHPEPVWRLLLPRIGDSIRRFLAPELEYRSLAHLISVNGRVMLEL